jgi:hypothetical protein
MNIEHWSLSTKKTKNYKCMLADALSIQQLKHEQLLLIGKTEQ